MPHQKGIKITKVRTDRAKVRERIIAKFGVDKVNEAKVRLCSRCNRFRCLPLPITSDGEDCPYFQARELRE